MRLTSATRIALLGLAIELTIAMPPLRQRIVARAVSPDGHHEAVAYDVKRIWDWHDGTVRLVDRRTSRVLWEADGFGQILPESLKFTGGNEIRFMTLNWNWNAVNYTLDTQSGETVDMHAQ